MSEEEYIYDPKLLKDLEFEQKHIATYSGEISSTNPGPNLLIRPLSRSDYDKDYLKLLTALTNVGEVTKEQFEERWKLMSSCPNTYFITVIEDTSTAKIIGNATLHVEYKFTDNLGLRGRVEDVAVLESYRGCQLGKLLVDVTNLICRKVGCFRVSLHCHDHFISLYKKMGFFIDEAENIMWLQPKYL